MKQHKAEQLINDYFDGDLATEVIAAIQHAERTSCEQKHAKQIQQLEKQVAYWKLSFHKQIEAQRRG